ncbi:MAG: hypothetical protein ABI949_05695 [Ilumatobacteraceae bacterium]
MNEQNPSDLNHSGQGVAEQRLADQLRRQAQSLDIVDTPLASVVRRGNQRRERRRVAVGLAAVAILSGTAIGAIQLLSQPVSHRVRPATDSEPGEGLPTTMLPSQSADDGALTPVTRVASDVVWNVVEPGSTKALGSVIWDNTALAGQKPPYLAWSSAPGKTANQDFVSTLYRSDDGIHWTASGGASFVQPDISMRGVGSRAGRLFAFGTAAATAPIPKGGGGDVVVDVSDDQGASWHNITLPMDLRGLSTSKGVQSVGFQGDMVVTQTGVVAVGVPVVNVDPSVYSGHNGGYIARRDGAILLDSPTCGGTSPTPTISYGGGYAPADTTPAGATTTNVVPVTAAADSCANGARQESGLIPWSDLGVDSTAVAQMFSPRVFVSTDGQNFVEGVFPALPDGYQLGQIDVVATTTGYAATATLYAPTSGSLAKLYTSTDGMTWSEADMPSGQYNSTNVLPDGTIVAFGSDTTTGAAFTAVSSDGVEWSKMSLGSLLDPTDGKSAMLNIGVAAAGPTGITAVGSINVDAAVEAGGFSIEKDGVRLTMTSSSYQSLVATDIATGAELGSWDGRKPPAADAALTNDDQGGFVVHAEDGSVRVTFGPDDMQSLYINGSTPKGVVLHSADGINWSRDDVKQLVGFDSYGATRLQATDTNTLISFVDVNSRDAKGFPKTVMLVGTARS